MSRSELRLSDIHLSVASGNDDDGGFPTFELRPPVQSSHRRSASAGHRGRSARPATGARRPSRSGSLPSRTKYEMQLLIQDVEFRCYFNGVSIFQLCTYICTMYYASEMTYILCLVGRLGPTQPYIHPGK